MHAVTLAPASSAAGGGGGAGAVAAAAIAASLGGGGGRTGAAQGPAGGRLGAAATPAPPRASAALPWVVPALTPEPVAAVAGAGASAVARARASPSASRVTLPGPDGAEVGRVLGGGVVRGALTLIGGDPGVGKSTLLLQVAALLGGHLAAPAAASTPSPMVLYASAEESVDQVGARAARLGLADAAPGLHLLSATRVEDLLPLLAASPPPAALVVDSIQTVYLDAAPGAAGSVTQVRECAAALMRVAKAAGVPVFLVGHVTKSGDIAGPRVLEHLVDAVLYLEGSRHADLRILRAVKNRYGPTDEVGVFRMDEGGLRAVPNPSAALVAERALAPSVASAVTVAVEGSAPCCWRCRPWWRPRRAGGGGGASGGPGRQRPPCARRGGSAATGWLSSLPSWPSTPACAWGGRTCTPTWWAAWTCGSRRPTWRWRSPWPRPPWTRPPAGTRPRSGRSAWAGSCAGCPPGPPPGGSRQAGLQAGRHPGRPGPGRHWRRRRRRQGRGGGRRPAQRIALQGRHAAGAGGHPVRRAGSVAAGQCGRGRAAAAEWRWGCGWQAQGGGRGVGGERRGRRRMRRARRPVW